MTNIQLFGVLVGSLSLIISFIYFRGKRWHKFNFIFSLAVGSLILVISLKPDFLNFMKNLFSLQDGRGGRMFGILIVSIVFLYFMFLYLKTKYDNVKENFDLTPGGIIEHLKLRRPIYKRSASYGHFGRDEEGFTWEEIDKAEELKKSVK